MRFERRPVAIVEILHSASGIAEFGIVRGAVAHRLFDRPEILRDVRIDVGEHLLSIVEILIDIVVRIESVRFVEVKVIARNENGSTQQGRYDSICFHPVYRLKIELHACPVRPHRRIRRPQLFGINDFQIVQTEEVRTLQINLHIREAKNPFGQRIGNGQVTQFDEGTVPIPIRIVPVVVRIRQGCQSRHGRLRSAFGRPRDLVIEQRLRNVAVADQRFVERAVEQIDRAPRHALKIGRQFDPFVTGMEPETEIETGNTRSVHPNHIQIVDPVVAVLVAVFEIAGTHRRERLYGTFVDLHLALENADDLQSVTLSHPVAPVVEIIIGLILLTVSDHLAVQIGGVGVNSVGEILAAVVPGNRGVESPVLMLAGRLQPHADTDDTRHGGPGRDQDMAAPLEKSLDGSRETITERTQIEPHGYPAGLLGDKPFSREIPFSQTGIGRDVVGKIVTVRIRIPERLTPQFVRQIPVPPRNAVRSG